MSVFVNYYKCIVTDPGEAPPNWIPEGATEEDISNAKVASSDVHNVKAVVWCGKCDRCKPRRAHHCRMCNKCRLKMDHHCPWIDNCVGHFNHKYFFLFLSYASLGLCDAIICFGWRVVEILMGTPAEHQLHLVMLILNIAFAIPITGGIGFLLIHQFWVLLKNTTTIEESVRKWQEIDAKKANQPYKWPYDYGWLENFKQVLGSSIPLWFIATPPETDGLNWRMEGKFFSLGTVASSTTSNKIVSQNV